MLEVEDLVAGHGTATVLHGVAFTVADGEVVALLGRNGMGKSTTIQCIMGRLPPRAGSIHFAGREIGGWPSHRIARLGLGWVPEGRQIFPNLSVEEHLAAFRRAGGRWTTDALFALFPRLRERRRSLGRYLSGGEQQMLAIARALATKPRLLILDEATEGLAPLIRSEIFERLASLKADGLAILLVDKPHRALDGFVDRSLVMEKGRIVFSGTPADLARDPDRRRTLLGIS